MAGYEAGFEDVEPGEGEGMDDDDDDDVIVVGQLRKKADSIRMMQERVNADRLPEAKRQKKIYKPYIP